MVNKKNNDIPPRRARYIGTSMVVTIDPRIVKQANIDQETFFSQEVIDGGILMKMRRLAR
jgi:hypothetical protein